MIKRWPSPAAQPPQPSRFVSAAGIHTILTFAEHPRGFCPSPGRRAAATEDCGQLPAVISILSSHSFVFCSADVSLNVFQLVNSQCRLSQWLLPLRVPSFPWPGQHGRRGRFALGAAVPSSPAQRSRPATTNGARFAMTRLSTMLRRMRHAIYSPKTSPFTQSVRRLLPSAPLRQAPERLTRFLFPCKSLRPRPQLQPPASHSHCRSQEGWCPQGQD